MILQQNTWCSKEFKSVKLEDERLNRRVFLKLWVIVSPLGRGGCQYYVLLLTGFIV